MEQYKNINYEIIGSGSSGNSVIIENIMIDCGLPYKKLKDYLYDVDYLLITHTHQDHVKKSTYNAIVKDFPNIIIASNYEVARKYHVDEVMNEGNEYELGEYVITPFSGPHDVLVYGYAFSIDDINIIYATDMNNYKRAPKIKYDLLFLEANHDEKKLQAISKSNAKRQYGYDVVASAKRHCSRQKCKAFYFVHRRDKDSKLIELHKSSRFY